MKNKRLFIEVFVLIGVIILALVVGIQNKKKMSIASIEEKSVAQEKESTDRNEQVTDRYEHIEEITNEFERGTKSKQETIVLLQQELNRVFDVENTQAMTKRVEEGKVDREKVKKYEELQTFKFESLQFQLPGYSKDYEEEIHDLENTKALLITNAKEEFKILVMPKYKADTLQGIIDCLKGKAAEQCKTYLVNTYGEEVLNSGYMYQKITENSVMQDINSNMISEEILLLPCLLVGKYMTLVNGTMDQGSISFEDEYIKAMQTGRRGTIILKIYDNKGYFDSVVISSKKEVDYRELINCILATVEIE